MGSYGVFQDIPSGNTETVYGTLQIAPPAAVSNVNSTLVAGTLLEPYQAIAANSTGTQASGTPITSGVRIVTVSSGGSAYSVTLPPSVPGMRVTVVTTTATNTVAVFPNAGGTGSETINALSANGGITMAAKTRADFVCVVAGQWYTVPLLPS